MRRRAGMSGPAEEEAASDDGEDGEGEAQVQLTGEYSVRGVVVVSPVALPDVVQQALLVAVAGVWGEKDEEGDGGDGDEEKALERRGVVTGSPGVSRVGCSSPTRTSLVPLP